jgi:hypothetical protein
MKGVILWSILVTCVIATGGNNEKRDSGAEIKGPGCKFKFLYNELNFFKIWN